MCALATNLAVNKNLVRQAQNRAHSFAPDGSGPGKDRITDRFGKIEGRLRAPFFILLLVADYVTAPGAANLSYC